MDYNVIDGKTGEPCGTFTTRAASEIPDAKYSDKDRALNAALQHYLNYLEDKGRSEDAAKCRSLSHAIHDYLQKTEESRAQEDVEPVHSPEAIRDCKAKPDRNVNRRHAEGEDVAEDRWRLEAMRAKYENTEKELEKLSHLRKESQVRCDEIEKELGDLSFLHSVLVSERDALLDKLGAASGQRLRDLAAMFDFVNEQAINASRRRQDVVAEIEAIGKREAEAMCTKVTLKSQIRHRERCLGLGDENDKRLI